jgi:hypothetical protein
MGFNKRFIKFENIICRLENSEPLSNYFFADALFLTDDKSKKIFDLHNKGVSDTEILKIIKNGELD